MGRTGCQWKNLPKDYPNHNSVYYYYGKWMDDGTWRWVNQALGQLEGERSGRAAEPSASIIDTQSVKTTEAGGLRGYDAGKRVKGRKRHIVEDTLGNLLEVVVHAANPQDRDRLLQERLVDWVRERMDARLQVAPRPSQHKGFQVLPRRWVVGAPWAG